VLLLYLFAGVTFEEADLAPRLWYIGRFLSRLGTYCLVVLGLDSDYRICWGVIDWWLLLRFASSSNFGFLMALRSFWVCLPIELAYPLLTLVGAFAPASDPGSFIAGFLDFYCFAFKAFFFSDSASAAFCMISFGRSSSSGVSRIACILYLCWFFILKSCCISRAGTSGDEPLPFHPASELRDAVAYSESWAVSLFIFNGVGLCCYGCSGRSFAAATSSHVVRIILGARSSRTLCSSFTASALIALAPLAFPEAPLMKFVLSSEPCPRLGTASMFYREIKFKIKFNYSKVWKVSNCNIHER